MHIDRIDHVRPRLRSAPGVLTWGMDRCYELALRARLFSRVASLCRRHGLRAVCIADDETVGWLIRPAQRLLGCRVVLYVHGDDLGEQPARLRARRRRQFACADATVAPSEHAAATLMVAFNVPSGRIAVIRNGVDTVLFRPLPADPALARRWLPDGCSPVVCVARLVKRKGVDRLIEAWPAVLSAAPSAFLLVVGDGPHEHALKAMVAQLGLGSRIAFAGAVPADAVPRYLALGDVMAMPHRRTADGDDEGAPLVFLEANACGKPVIAGRAGGAPELVEDGVNGLLVDGDDLAAIAAAVLRLLGDPELRARMAQAGLARAREASWARAAAAFLVACAG